MKYYIIPAKDVQCGDVIFTSQTDEEGNGVPFCGRVIGETIPRPHPNLTQWRMEVVVGTEETPQGTFTAISFQHNTLVGVVREDEYVDTDVAAMLAGLTNE